MENRRVTICKIFISRMPWEVNSRGAYVTWRYCSQFHIVHVLCVAVLGVPTEAYSRIALPSPYQAKAHSAARTHVSHEEQVGCHEKGRSHTSELVVHQLERLHAAFFTDGYTTPTGKIRVVFPAGIVLPVRPPGCVKQCFERRPIPFDRPSTRRHVG